MTNEAESSYEILEARFGQIGALGEAARVLTWDRSVNMPRKGARGRAEQLASLRRVVHEKTTDRGDAGSARCGGG